MRWKAILLFVCFLAASVLQAQITTTHGKLKLIHAKATPTKAKVTIKIVQPAQDEVVAGPDVTVRFEATNWTPQDGKHFHLMVDNEPFHPHHSGEPFVFKNVSPGAHAIRVFPVYGWHETVKQQQALATVQFYVKEKSGNLPLDLSKPMMIYSTPVGTHRSDEKLPGQPHPGVLVDWFLHGVSMGSKAGYFVRINVNGVALMSMKEWRPHYLQGLPAGNHKIKLELLRNGKPVVENWSVTERTITVQ